MSIEHVGCCPEEFLPAQYWNESSMNHDNYIGLCNPARDYIYRLFYGKKTYFDDDVF